MKWVLEYDIEREYDDCRWDDNRIESEKSLLFHEHVVSRKTEKTTSSLKSLNDQGIIAIEYLGGTFDRMAVYTTDGKLKISDFPDFVPGHGWPPAQEVILRNWEEICRLRDFLNQLQPVHGEVKHHAATA